VLSRLFALFLLLALIAAGLYFWKVAPGGLRLEGFGQVGDKLKNTKMTAEVKTALALNRTLKPYGLDASVENGVATLRGNVPSEDVKRLADSVVAAVPGVTQVVSHVRIAPEKAVPTGAPDRSIGESLDDGSLEVQVRLAFSLRKDLEGTDLTTKVYRRQVTLSGEVASPNQKTVALATAREVPGVEGVVDQIRLKGEKGSAGGASAAEAALQGNDNLKGYGLKVVEERGRLVLHGRVRTAAEKDLAGLLTQQAGGLPVENALEIRP
jgi:osmotically-inducible protein OsmY